MPAELPERAVGRPNVNILLVDDRPENLLVLEAVLIGLAVNPVKAHSGEEALALLETDEYAVILLDVQMRGLDGFETAKQIRQSAGTRTTPIIFVTGFDAAHPSAEEAYALGAVDYLVKPLVPAILRAKVAGFVELFLKTEQIKRQSEQLREMERKLAEEALRQSEERFAGFMQHLPGLAWIKDVTGRYVYANEAATITFCRSREELYGKTDDEIFPPETATAFRQHDRDALECGKGIQIVETLRHQDGSIHHSLVSKFPIPGSDGRPALVGGMAIDITDRLRAEEALRESDRLKDEFLAMLGHELRNPISGISGAVEVLARMPQSGSDAREMLEIIQRQTGHIRRMVDDLLEVSRVSRGKLEIRPELLDLSRLVRNACEELRPSFSERQLALRLDLPEQAVDVSGDPTRLTQVLVNLLQNAFKFSEPGGEVSVALRHDAEHGRAILSVRDTGIGMSREILAHVFQPFCQGHNGRHLQGGGLGLGLALVKGLIELHGGQVAATSPGPGLGSEFTVHLRLARQLPEPRGPMPVPAELRPQKILIIDDQRDASYPMRKLLELDGHQVATAADGPAGIELARQFRPDVVLCDIGMAGMDGYAVARQLRAEAETRNAALVAVTGYGQNRDRRLAAEAGFDYHLTKPASQDDLRALLAGRLERVRPSQD